MATEPGVVTAAALDWSGRYADYNCRQDPTGTVHVVRAFGGTEDDPLGFRTSPAGGVARLYGSSYAAALVACALLTQG